MYPLIEVELNARRLGEGAYMVQEDVVEQIKLHAAKSHGYETWEEFHVAVLEPQMRYMQSKRFRYVILPLRKIRYWLGLL